MGGSSLFPEVVAAGKPVPARRPRCTCSTRPTRPPSAGWPASCRPTARCTSPPPSRAPTLETRSHLAWAWERHPDQAGFAVITDPGSELAALAAEQGFADTFENPPDIGGRYSALSLFGLVPALLVGADVEGLLGAASAMSDRLRASAAANPAAAWPPPSPPGCPRAATS